MIKLENLERKMRVNGIIPNQTVVLINLEQNGPSSVSVAYRIRLGHHFDRILAVHTSLIKPLPH